MLPYCKKIPLEFNPISCELPIIAEPYKVITFSSADASAELLDFTAKAGISHFILQGFFTNKWTVRSRCHIDTPHDGPPSRARINWIFGGSKSYMQWLDVGDQPYTLNSANGVPYMSYEMKGTTVLHTEFMVGAYAVETAIPHVVQNPSPDHRWCITIIPFFHDNRSSIDELLTAIGHA